MNILWVSLYPPLPLNFGGPVGIYHRLVEISKENKIFLFYINDDNDETYDMRLKEYCVDVHSYTRNKVVSFEVLKNIIRYPYTVATRNISSMKRDIQTCIENNKIDLINVEFPQMVVNLIGVKKDGIPIILHEHNNEWNRFAQMSKSYKGKLSFFYKRESRKLFSFERKLEKKNIINSYSFLSDKDRDNFINEFNIPRNRTFLVPLGSTELLLDDILHNGIVYMFCAAMDSEMNEEAVIWFYNKVFPKVKAVIKEAKFYIVGRNPSKRIRSLEGEDVIVTGAVESLNDYYRLADVIVIPLLHGGGVKVKLLEAVGRGKIIVTTPVGCEGTLFNSSHMYITDNENTFAVNCIEAVKNKDKSIKMRNEMYRFFKNNYTWSSIGKKYQLNMNSVVKKYSGK